MLDEIVIPKRETIADEVAPALARHDYDSALESILKESNDITESYENDIRHAEKGKVSMEELRLRIEEYGGRILLAQKSIRNVKAIMRLGFVRSAPGKDNIYKDAEQRVLDYMHRLEALQARLQIPEGVVAAGHLAHLRHTGENQKNVPSLAETMENQKSIEGVLEDAQQILRAFTIIHNLADGFIKKTILDQEDTLRETNELILSFNENLSEAHRALAAVTHSLASLIYRAEHVISNPFYVKTEDFSKAVENIAKNARELEVCNAIHEQLSFIGTIKLDATEVYLFHTQQDLTEAIGEDAAREQVNVLRESVPNRFHKTRQRLQSIPGMDSDHLENMTESMMTADAGFSAIVHTRPVAETSVLSNVASLPVRDIPRYLVSALKPSEHETPLNELLFSIAFDAQTFDGAYALYEERYKISLVNTLSQQMELLGRASNHAPPSLNVSREISSDGIPPIAAEYTLKQILQIAYALHRQAHTFTIQSTENWRDGLLATTMGRTRSLSHVRESMYRRYLSELEMSIVKNDTLRA